MLCDGGYLASVLQKIPYDEGGGGNMTITTNVANCINDQVTAYRELAQKAWGGNPIGNRDSRVVAALKQFFYNLDFLLKYGHFPSVEDTAQNALPKELRGLKEFLETSPCKGKSYILQKDANTRYRFTWTEAGKVSVAEELCPSWFQDREKTLGKPCIRIEGEYVWRMDYSHLIDADRLRAVLWDSAEQPACEPV